MKSNRPSMATVLTMKAGGNQTVAPMIIPPDGGWGWVIVMTGFISSTIIDGISYCFFLYRDPMMKDLQIQPGDISFLSALFTGFYFLGGILACSAGNHFGFRPIMLLGAVVVVCCLTSGYVLNDITFYYVIVGVIGGMAAGFIFVSGALPVGFYFDKKRCIAVGLVGSGSGVGAAVVPQATNLFLNRFGWRETFLFHASLCGVLALLGLLIRPLRPVMVVIRHAEGESRMSMWTLRDAGSSPIDMSLFQVHPDSESIGPSSIGVGRSVLANQMQACPTIEQIAHDIDVISIRVRDNTERSLLVKLTEMTQSRILQPSASVVGPSIIVEEEESPGQRSPWYKCGCCHGRSTVPERPLLRTDLYYTGSLTQLDEFTTKDRDVEYHMHVTKLPTYFETMQDLTRKYTAWCCSNILHGIRTLLNYSLLKSPTFVCLALCGFSNYIAFFLPFLYGKVRLELIGKENEAVNLVSMLGLGNMLGRMASGFIMSLIPRFGARSVAAFTSLVAGITVVCCTFYHHIAFQFSMMLLYGAAVGFFAPLRSLIIVDFFGLDTLTSATGMMILFQGMGSFLGAPLAEAVLKITKNDNSPYYVCGGFLMFASITLWPMRIFQRWEKRRKEKRKP